MCSDGLVDEVGDESIARILQEHKEPQEAADALVKAANDNGGRDNITVVVADVLDGGELSEPTEEYDVDAIFGVDEITGEVAVVELDSDPGYKPPLKKSKGFKQSPRPTKRQLIQRSAIGIAALTPRRPGNFDSWRVGSIELHRLIHRVWDSHDLPRARYFVVLTNRGSTRPIST